VTATPRREAFFNGLNWLATKLGHFLLMHLDWSEYQVRINSGRVRRPGTTYYVPDVFVLATAIRVSLPLRDEVLQTYDHPLPLGVDVWSRSTGENDITEQLAGYQQRGDLEIWCFHTYERTLASWRRQTAATPIQRTARASSDPAHFRA
jgi:hypothetical protein